MPFMVLHKGDGDRGLIMIKQNVIGDGCRVHTQLRDMEGRMHWRRPLGDDLITEAKADDYITRQRDFDEDLWVIEVEDPKGQYTPNDPV